MRSQTNPSPSYYAKGQQVAFSSQTRVLGAARSPKPSALAEVFSKVMKFHQSHLHPLATQMQQRVRRCLLWALESSRVDDAEQEPFASSVIATFLHCGSISLGLMPIQNGKRVFAVPRCAFKHAVATPELHDACSRPARSLMIALWSSSRFFRRVPCK